MKSWSRPTGTKPTKRELHHREHQSGKLFSAVGSSTLSESMNFTPGLRMRTTAATAPSRSSASNGLRRPLFTDTARQPPDIQFAGHGLRPRPASRLHDRAGGGGTRGRLGPLRSQRHRRRRKHHHQGPLYSTLNVSNITNVFGNGKLDINTSIGGAFVSDDHKAGMYIFGMVEGTLALRP